MLEVVNALAVLGLVVAVFVYTRLFAALENRVKNMDHHLIILGDGYKAIAVKLATTEASVWEVAKDIKSMRQVAKDSKPKVHKPKKPAHKSNGQKTEEKSPNF